jgi:hypothetical protein
LFEADANSSPDPAWLVDASGNRVSIVWPEGFRLIFDPAPGLLDERGQVVARLGALVTLEQVDRALHTGSFEDPYLATGTLFNSCYPSAP